MKVAVLISGRGSNLQALIDAGAAPGWPAEIVLVISNVASAEGLLHQGVFKDSYPGYPANAD